MGKAASLVPESNIAKRAKLTRIDLAHDDFDGSHISVDWADEQDNDSIKGTGFQNGARKPNVEHKGNWKRPNGRGRTLNIGSRESGMYVRDFTKKAVLKVIPKTIGNVPKSNLKHQTKHFTF